MYIVSACLLGENCKYNGGNNSTSKVKEFIKGHNYISVCPESTGGLPTPRPPSEICEGRIVNDKNQDVTDQFLRGAVRNLEEAREKACHLGEEIELAILKSKSPSCGSGKIYDGTFTGTLTDGNGIFAQLLKDNGIKVISEEEILDDKF